MADETTAEQSPPKKKPRLFKVMILIILGAAVCAALVLFLQGSGFKKVDGMPSQALRMKMPNPTPSSKPSQKPLKQATIKTAPKRSLPKAAVSQRIVKPVNAAISQKIVKPVKVAALPPVVAQAKVAMAPDRSSAPPDEIDYEFEMRSLNSLLKTDAKNTNALYNRGWLNERSGNLASAEKDYTQAIEIDRRLVEAYFNRGLVFIDMKRYELAAQDFTEVIKMQPRAVDAYCNRGNAYFNLGKRNFALKDYDAALEIDPNDADIYFNRGIVRREKGDEAAAMADFTKALNLGLDRASQYLKSPQPEKPEALSNAPSKMPSKSSVETSATTTLPGTPPAGSATGKIHGVEFKVEKAEIANGILTLRQGSDFFPDYAVLIFLFLKEGETADGTTFNITKEQGFGSPHIHMKWKQNGQNNPKTEIFLKDYIMRLVFGKRENGRLPGKISLSLPDKDQSFVNGSFFAEIK